jgi:hypothetical protein
VDQCSYAEALSRFTGKPPALWRFPFETRQNSNPSWTIPLPVKDSTIICINDSDWTPLFAYRCALLLMCFRPLPKAAVFCLLYFT